MQYCAARYWETHELRRTVSSSVFSTASNSVSSAVSSGASSTASNGVSSTVLSSTSSTVSSGGPEITAVLQAAPKRTGITNGNDYLTNEGGEQMPINQTNRKTAYLLKAKAELTSLAERGVVMSGNAFSSLLLVKGDLSPDERHGAAILSGADGKALHQAFEALGYAPEDWAGLSSLMEDTRGTTSAADGLIPREGSAASTPTPHSSSAAGTPTPHSSSAAGTPTPHSTPAASTPTPHSTPTTDIPLPPELFREAVAALEPTTIVVLDEVAADVVRTAYTDQLLKIQELDEALLKPGLVVRILGMRVLNLGSFSRSLNDPQYKQWAWACLKRIPPLGEPY